MNLESTICTDDVIVALWIDFGKAQPDYEIGRCQIKGDR